MKKYVLFGSGARAVKILEFIGHNLNIAYVIDNDRNKWENEFYIYDRKLQVFSPDVLKTETLNDIEIVIGSVSTQEMLEQLEKVGSAFAKYLTVRCISINDSLRGRLRTYLASFCDFFDKTLRHDYSIANIETLVFKISDKQCAIQINKVFVNSEEISDYRNVLKTNGEWVNNNTIHFACYNPTIYIEEHDGIDIISVHFHFIETDYKNAYKFMYDLYDGLSNFANNINPEFVPEDDYVPLEFGKNDVKPIAFYLPQYHKVPQNDQWWEKGFTEWTNVTKAYPLFEGHNQPHLPIDMGFYDLCNIDVQKRQIELAKKYGVYGFCYYYYQYENLKLLDAPINRHLNNKDFDFPFCIFWANENWTRVWSGEDDEILAEVGKSDDFYQRTIKDICEYCKDSRYIRVDGKPLIIIYHIRTLPDPKHFAQLCRDLCRDEGIGEIMLLHVKNSCYPTNPNEYGFDGMTEFFPFVLIGQMKDVTYKHRLYDESFSGRIFDYKELVESRKYISDESCLLYKNAFPCWDNAARYHRRATLFHGSSPQLYRRWLEDIIDYTRLHHKSQDKYVFINAWNEWAEGAHLEPDRKYGYAYLKATREAVLGQESFM